MKPRTKRIIRNTAIGAGVLAAGVGGARLGRGLLAARSIGRVSRAAGRRVSLVKRARANVANLWRKDPRAPRFSVLEELDAPRAIMKSRARYARRQIKRLGAGLTRAERRARALDRRGLL